MLAAATVGLSLFDVSYGATWTTSYPPTFGITDRDNPGQVVLKLKDFSLAPRSFTIGSSDTRTSLQVARINFIRQEPVAGLAAQRLWMPDLNGNLYIYNRAADTYTPGNNAVPYLDVRNYFPSFDSNPGFAAGLVTVQFDPDYANNGKFYTVHTENTAASTTAFRDAVLEEWQDTNINNTSYDGNGPHELLRVSGYVSNVHPIGDIAFNPKATPGSPDWRNMYIASGDGATGENTTQSVRNRDQMLGPAGTGTLSTNFLGKVLRIAPTANVPATGVNGTYTTPADNPFSNNQTFTKGQFVSGAGTFNGAQPEVYAYGFRNPHRLEFDVDNDANQTVRLFVDDIGLNSYEELNLVKKGGNYGYAGHEGKQTLPAGLTSVTMSGSSAVNDQLPVYVTTQTSQGNITAQFPVAAFSHRDGDAISNGFVYRGTKIPQLYGKYVFGDVPSGRLFYCDMAALVAADDGSPLTEAAIHEMRVLYNSPYDTATDAGLQTRRLFEIGMDAYDRRFETLLNERTAPSANVNGDKLPGSATYTNNGNHGAYASDPVYVGGRVDFRWGLIDGELYLITKSDGVIREVSAPLYGDANDDGVVNALDFNAVASHFGSSGQSWLNGDFNFNGMVNSDDFTLLSQNWGKSAPSSPLPGSVVPEPAVVVVSLSAFLFAGLRRRKFLS